MAKLVFFKNVRTDGGVRTGIEVDDHRYFHHFVDGRKPRDSALDWFVDIICEGRAIPKKPGELKAFLLQLGPYIRKGLQELAERLQAGLDEQPIPFSYSVKPAPAGLKVTIKGSAIRRIRAEDIAKNLLHTLERLEQDIGSLPAA